MSTDRPELAALMRLREEQPELALKQAQALLANCDEFSPGTEVALLHLVTSWVYETQGDWLPALEAATRATRLAAPLGGEWAAQAWIRLASVQSQLQAYADALECIDKAGSNLALMREPTPRRRNGCATSHCVYLKGPAVGKKRRRWRLICPKMPAPVTALPWPMPWRMPASDGPTRTLLHTGWNAAGPVH
ncbi:hypothetical protein [Ideonella paludis]|uniref:hypothetical protein n=1 Tax=Ideonella paludis TaxID=1233411 RepID=UPI00363FA1C7